MVPEDPSPNFCASCGARLGADAAFCSQCGAAVDGAAGRGRGERRGRDEFRERVREYAVHGWEIEQDYGDRVIVRKRGFGLIPVHVLLFFFTGGVGNLLYAWYRYGPGASRAELRADGRERWVDGRAGESPVSDRAAAAGIVVGGLLILGVVFLYSQTALAGVALLAVALAVSLYWLLPRRDSAAARRSPATFGRERTIEESPTDDGSRPCAVCGSATSGGVVREYAERFYLAGIPVKTYESGENRYCPRCATDDTAAGGPARELIREAGR